APVKRDDRLEARLRQTLSELAHLGSDLGAPLRAVDENPIGVSRRLLVGAQVAVVQKGRVICSLAHGT
ncbi:unnamed protein product, partial [Effrenium voratum]